MLALLLLRPVQAAFDCSGLITNAATGVDEAVAAHECILNGIVQDVVDASASCTAGSVPATARVSGCTGSFASTNEIDGYQTAQTSSAGSAYQLPGVSTMVFDRATTSTPKGTAAQGYLPSRQSTLTS